MGDENLRTRDKLRVKTISIIENEQITADHAFTDPITGLGNRFRMIMRMNEFIDGHQKDPVPFAMIIVNVDGFKPINNLYGRNAGDEILSQIANRLRGMIDETSLLARVGGDVFGLFVPTLYTEKKTLEFCELITDVMSAAFDLGANAARMTASIGAVMYTHSGDRAESMIEKAESAVNAAKQNGRGQALVYSEAMAKEERFLTRVELNLRNAISEGVIEPHFQPIVDLNDGRVIGFESLARWTDPELGSIRPDIFIKIAEERGMIGPLTDLLLQKSVKTARLWPSDMFLSFNLSPSHMIDANTGLKLLSILNKAGFDPRRLDIEITESAVMQDASAASKVIEDLRRCGIRISLDDFGTGQSSLSRLREIPFNKLKIDRAFISTINDDRAAEMIVRAILTMCEGLKMGVIAEGIEEWNQVKTLTSLGCVGGQGYLYGRPADAAATTDLLNMTKKPRSAKRA